MKVKHLVTTKIEVEIEGKTKYYITVRQPDKEKLITLSTPSANMIHFPPSQWSAIQDGIEKALREDAAMRKMLENV